MSAATLRTLVRRAGWIVAGVLAVLLWSHRAALERANQRLAEKRPLAERTSVRDRLIGTDLSELRFRDLGGGRVAAAQGGTPSLVWLVDPRTCAGCLSDLSPWAELSSPRLPVTTVLVGVGREQARRIRGEVDLPGRVAFDPGGEMAASLGMSDALPSLFLVLDRSGTVLMTEARRSSAACDWSFVRQVAALLSGFGSGASVRTLGP